MVIGIGVDIIEIDRIQNSIDKYGDHFLNKVFTQVEIDYCGAKANKYQHYAARFAAKEAVYKAISTGWNTKANWQSIEVFNDDSGMPFVNLKDGLKEFLGTDKDLKISMSHSRDYVVCTAIIYKKV